MYSNRIVETFLRSPRERDIYEGRVIIALASMQKHTIWGTILEPNAVAASCGAWH